MYMTLEGVMNSIHLLLLHCEISLRHFLERPHQGLVLPCSHKAAIEAGVVRGGTHSGTNGAASR